MVISQVTTIKNGKMTQQLPPTTQKSHLALWVFSCFLFSFRTRPPQEKKNNNKKNKYHHRNFSAFFGAVFLGLPNRQVTISGDSFTIQCHHPPADEDSKLVRHVRWEPSIGNINPKKNECQTCVSIEAFGGEKAPERVIRKNFQHEKWDRKPKIVRSRETLSKWMCMFQKQIAWISGSMDQVDSGL